MDCFKFQKENQQYLQQNIKQYERMVLFIKKLLTFDHQIYPYFPYLEATPQQSFQKLILRNYINQQQRIQNLWIVSSAFFQLNTSIMKSNIQNFSYFLSRHSSVPIIIRVYLKIYKLKQNIELNKDLCQSLAECFKIRQLFKNKKQYKQNKQFKNTINLKSSKFKVISNSQQNVLLFYAQWKIQTCWIILCAILRSKDLSKKYIIAYIQIAKRFNSLGLINISQQTKIYQYLLKLQLNPQIKRYIQIEYKSICNRMRNKDILKLNQALQIEKIKKKQNQQEIRNYLQSDERQKVFNKIKVSEAIQKRRSNFNQTLHFFTYRRNSRSQIGLSLRHKKHTTSSSLRSEHKSTENKHKFDEIHNHKKIKCRITRNSIRDKILLAKQESNQQKNLYNKLFNLSNKEKLVNISDIEEQLNKIIVRDIEKSTPIMEEILIQELNVHQNNCKQSPTTISFNGTFNNSEVIFSKKINLHFIHCFCNQIVYLQITNNPYTNGYTFNLTSFCDNISDNLDDKQLSFQQSYKQIQLSQLYFQLIQEKVESDINVADSQFISSFLKLENEKNSSVLIGLNRIGRALAFWYFTKAVKINGSILVKRQLPHMADPLKFSIALQFLKKFDHEVRLQKIGQSHNKTAIYECFRYLFYGRKIIAKGIVKTLKRNKYKFSFFTLSLQKMKQQNFIICPQSSYFTDLVFTLSMYSLQNNTEHKKQIVLDRLLNKKKLTLFLLNNITDNFLSPKITKKLLRLILKQQNCFQRVSQNKYFNSFPQKQGTQPIKIIEIDDNNLYSMEQKCCYQICTFLPILKYYIQIFQKGNDLAIIHKNHRIQKIGKKYYYHHHQFILKCGLSVQIVDKSDRNGNIGRSLCVIQYNGRQEQLKYLQTPYYNKIISVQRQDATTNILSTNILSTKYIRKNLIQKVRKKNMKTYFKFIIKNNEYLYVCLSWHLELLCWRLDCYQFETSKTFVSYLYGVDKHQYLQKQTKNICKNLKQSIQIQLRERKVFFGNKHFKLFQTFGTLLNIDKDSLNKGSIQLIQTINNRLYCWILAQQGCQTQTKLLVHEVEDSPLAYNTNLFADFARKQFKVNLYNDMFLRLYFKFIRWPGLPFFQLNSLAQLQNL